jgi:hypothetical protein
LPQVFELPIRVVFVVVNILQLAYLGVMFDSDPSQTEVSKLGGFSDYQYTKLMYYLMIFDMNSTLHVDYIYIFRM